ncbi:MAG: ABC transporter permease [Erysipelotrichaceae bacterium]
MRNYILGRVVRSIIAILVVVSIALVILYNMIPRSKIFENDPVLQKVKGDDAVVYKYNKWQELGYLDFKQAKDFCAESDNKQACMITGSKEQKQALTKFEEQGYVVINLSDNTPIIYRDYNSFEIVGRFYRDFLKIDTPNVVVDESNPNLERKYYVESGANGIPALKCSGCEYQYQLYVDGSFPFIHQNMLRLNFGKSYPTNQGVDTLEVISTGQGKAKLEKQTFPTGSTSKSAINQYTCRYKQSSTLDHLDTGKFTTNYANCGLNYDSPSMIGTSYLFGIVALILAYAIALPAGILMARKKDKWQDKVGVVYINFLIAVPSLAFIFIMKLIGMVFGLPDKFPQFGFKDGRSYILPMIILALLSTSAIMTWVRRYMVDQSNADYVKFAKAKGLSNKDIFNKHILKNAIIPIVNGIPASVVLCISGAVMTESVFAIPGMGKMLPDSIKALNNNMVITLTFIFTALSIFSLLLGDILMTMVDPRIQLTSKGETR